MVKSDFDGCYAGYGWGGVIEINVVVLPMSVLEEESNSYVSLWSIMDSSSFNLDFAGSNIGKWLCQSIQKENNNVIVKIRREHDKEFENAKFLEFCDSKGIDYYLSCSITSHQGGVVQQKTRAIHE